MAKDIIHDAVKNALIKDGWMITADPYRIEYEKLNLFADLSAERPFSAERAGRKIIVEIKSFVGRSFIDDLQKAIGQYNVYRSLVEIVAPDYELYLALSEFVHHKFLGQKAIQVIIKRTQIALLVVNVEQEEVVQWID